MKNSFNDPTRRSLASEKLVDECDNRNNKFVTSMTAFHDCFLILLGIYVKDKFLSSFIISGSTNMPSLFFAPLSLEDFHLEAKQAFHKIFNESQFDV